VNAPSQPSPMAEEKFVYCKGRCRRQPRGHPRCSSRIESADVSANSTSWVAITSALDFPAPETLPEAAGRRVVDFPRSGSSSTIKFGCAEHRLRRIALRRPPPTDWRGVHRVVWRAEFFGHSGILADRPRMPRRSAHRQEFAKRDGEVEGCAPAGRKPTTPRSALRETWERRSM